MRANGYRRPALLAAVLALSTLSLTGCGLFGGSWDVRMEVTGPGTASVTSKFAGETVDPKPQKLPFSAEKNVGFGFNELTVDGAQPGTVCRVLVDGKVRQESPVDAKGHAKCEANNQDD